MSPLTAFKCPDNIIRPISQCLESCPLPTGRCLSLPTLHTIGNNRKWTGVASTTQCLNPTRLEYLQIKYDYSVDPFAQAFALLGTRHHGKLEAVAKKLEGLKPELYMKGETSGILDLLEPINSSDAFRLIDYKTYGSYAVAKHLNLKENGEYDRRKLALQVNNYRLLAQELGFNITELKVQITVRDGNTFSARNNGVDKNIYLLPIEILPDDEVKEYFLTKSFKLKQAIDKDELPEWCGYEDTWNSRRCKGYCNIFGHCPEGAKLNKVEYLK